MKTVSYTDGRNGMKKEPTPRKNALMHFKRISAPFRNKPKGMMISSTMPFGDDFILMPNKCASSNTS
jgi:hypothetical protein